MSEYIEAKPTTYRGVSFHSRLEARWAVFLDYNPLINDWVYEPSTFTLTNKGWKYTPDFRIVMGPITVHLEIKPIEPTDEYLHICQQFAAQMHTAPLILCIGDFYDGRFSLTNLSANMAYKRFTQLFPASEDAMDTAKGYRFDIPYTPPPFRSGSEAKFKTAISGYQQSLRKLSRGKRRKKNE